VTIQFDRDLKTDIDVMVKSDRVLEIDRKPETTEEAPAPAAEEPAAEGDAPKAKGKKGKKADAE
jgi:hypothetical protein